MRLTIILAALLTFFLLALPAEAGPFRRGFVGPLMGRPLLALPLFHRHVPQQGYAGQACGIATTASPAGQYAPQRMLYVPQGGVQGGACAGGACPPR